MLKDGTCVGSGRKRNGRPPCDHAEESPDKGVCSIQDITVHMEDRVTLLKQTEETTETSMVFVLEHSIARHVPHCKAFFLHGEQSPDLAGLSNQVKDP